MSGPAGLYECSFGGKDAGAESVKVVTKAQAKSGKPVERVITPGGGERQNQGCPGAGAVHGRGTPDV